ncbi:MAG TPA: OmpA family protein [Nannocystaceae bacterium]|nr:OmpA family protein [Nannocystaceae bacterium]
MGQAKPIDPFPAPGAAASAPQPAVVEELDGDDLVDEPTPKPGVMGALPWILFGAAATSFAVFWIGVHRPQAKTHAELQSELDTRTEELAQARTALTNAHSELDDANERLSEQSNRSTEVATANDDLAAEVATLTMQRQQLEQTVADKEKALAAAQTKLEASLGEEIGKGEVTVRKRGDELVVDVDDRVLFGRGDATLEERGQKVMRRVAETMRANPERAFEIAGHTDDDPVAGKLAEQFPTNWELSTARATNVVRFLVEQCEVSGRQLVASGYAAERPVASNKSARGRKKNRRIEITMRAQPLAKVK